jgi:hypothetical protein
MLNDNQARLERQKTSPDEIDKQQEKLTGVQQKEYHNDLHMETNKIQSQNSPELYQNPPTIQAPGVTAPAPPAPQQQGPAGPAM